MSDGPSPALLQEAVFEALTDKVLTDTTPRIIRHAVETKFGGIHLRDRKKEIYRYIVSYVEGVSIGMG